MSSLYYTHVASPVGNLLIAGTNASLHFLSFPTGHKAFGPAPDWQQADAPFQNVRRQLNAYFAGELRCFDLPLQLSGTAFQNSVWQYLSGISFGDTRTYGQIAAQRDRQDGNKSSWTGPLKRTAHQTIDRGPAVPCHMFQHPEMRAIHRS